MASVAAKNPNICETFGLYPLERTVDSLITERQFDIDRCTRSALGHQRAQRCGKREQFGPEDVAFAHVDDAVRAALAEPQHCALGCTQCVQSGTSARIGRREMRRQHLSDRDPLPFGSVHHAIGDELPQGGLVGMLELATATGREMATGRRDMMRPRGQ